MDKRMIDLDSVKAWIKHFHYDYDRLRQAKKRGKSHFMYFQGYNMGVNDLYRAVYSFSKRNPSMKEELESVSKANTTQ